MKRTAFLMMTLILLSTLLSGCWSRKELNDLSLAAAIGIDKDGDQFKVSVQAIIPSEVASKKGGGYEVPVTVYTATSKTIVEAIRKMTTTAPRKIYLAQLRVVVIGEALARSGIGKAMDFLLRDHEVREEDLYVLIAKGLRAEETLQVLTRVDKIPAKRMYGSLSTLHKYWAPSPVIKLDEVSYDLLTSNKEIAIIGVGIQGQGKGDKKDNVESVIPSTFLKFVGASVFKKDKLIGWLNERESKGYNYITNRVIKTAGHFPCPAEGIIATDVVRTKTDVKGKIVKGEPQIDIHVRMEANVADVECSIDLTNPNSIDKLQELANKELQSIIKDTIAKVQHEFKSDIFGFGEAIHRSNPGTWKRIGKNWGRIFPNVPVNVTTDIKIRNMGTITDPSLKVMKE